MKRADFLFLPRVIVVMSLAIGVSGPIALRAQVQSSESHPFFEVAFIKQNTSNDRRSFGVQPGGRLVVRNVALKDLVAAAYGMADIPALVPDRILGGPNWIGSERYNIDAKASTEFHFAPGGPPKDMLLMLRSPLEERFKLVAHRETREMPMLSLSSRGRTEGSDRACASPASTATRSLRPHKAVLRRLHANPTSLRPVV